MSLHLGEVAPDLSAATTEGAKSGSQSFFTVWAFRLVALEQGSDVSCGARGVRK